MFREKFSTDVNTESSHLKVKLRAIVAIEENKITISFSLSAVTVG